MKLKLSPFLLIMSSLSDPACLVRPLLLRSCSQGDAACGDIRRQVPDASVQTLPLDLESIDSIRNFVDLFRETQLPLHVLINNAGQCFRRVLRSLSRPRRVDV